MTRQSMRVITFTTGASTRPLPTTTPTDLRVSSAPAERRVEVSGDRQVLSTLSVWPSSSAVFVIAGYLGHRWSEVVRGGQKGRWRRAYFQMTTSLEG